MTAQEANAQDGPVPDFLISGDLRKTVNHPYLFVGCHYWKTSAVKRSQYRTPNKHWMEMADDEILKTYSEDGKFFQYYKEGGYTNHGDGMHWPCSVLKQEDENGDYYTMRIHQKPWGHARPWETNNVPRILTGYPRTSMHYFVQPMASDQPLPGVFRHPIMIPDDMFPAHWKNRINK
jgi:hypothetical protein